MGLPKVFLAHGDASRNPGWPNKPCSHDTTLGTAKNWSPGMAVSARYCVSRRPVAFAPLFMPILETSPVRPNAQHHLEVVLSIAQAVPPSVLPPPVPIATPISTPKWAELTADWLDTPANHCSPLDDY
jgi:hypothetical protein